MTPGRIRQPYNSTLPRTRHQLPASLGFDLRHCHARRLVTGFRQDPVDVAERGDIRISVYRRNRHGAEYEADLRRVVGQYHERQWGWNGMVWTVDRSFEAVAIALMDSRGAMTITELL